ncbi:GNAT family N-acetyltransferase [Janibacter sp. LM]|uniref:GNAT family N-acetyltransferase n=1 Tax=Janibacter TaxID=53457 RepID=UPI0031F6AB19
MAQDELVIRSATPRDEGGIARLLAGLSPTSARLRFSHAVAPDEIADLAVLRPGTTSVVALRAGVVVAEARYERTSEDEPPELAMAVADGQQGRGLGTRMLGALRERAAADGLLTLRAVVRTDNRGMLRLLRTTSAAIAAPVEQGEVVFDLATDDLMPPWPTGRAARKVLIETRTLLDTPEVEALWEAGVEVRKCQGPVNDAGRTCPALEHGECRLADTADAVVSLLPQDDPTCRLIADDHATHRGEALVARTHAQWREAAPGLTEQD